MFFSQTTEYALRSIVWLAANNGSPQTAHQIAKSACISESYLSKLLQSLRRQGLVEGRRGIYGGFSLVKKPEDLTVLDIINAVEPLKRIHQCPLGLASHGTNLCTLHRKLDDAIGVVEEMFRSTTIADVLKETNGIRPMCEKFDKKIDKLL